MPNSTIPDENRSTTTELLTINENRLTRPDEKIGSFWAKEKIYQYNFKKVDGLQGTLLIPYKGQHHGVEIWDLKNATCTVDGKNVTPEVTILDYRGKDVSTNYTVVKESQKIQNYYDGWTAVISGIGLIASAGYMGYMYSLGVPSGMAALIPFFSGVGIMAAFAVLVVVVLSKGQTLVKEAQNKESCASTLKQTQTPQPAAGISSDQHTKVNTTNPKNDRPNTIQGNPQIVNQKDGNGESNKCT